MSTDDDLRRAVDRFLDDADTALGEYDRGYADADATLAVVETHIDSLRETATETEE